MEIRYSDDPAGVCSVSGMDADDRGIREASGQIAGDGRTDGGSGSAADSQDGNGTSEPRRDDKKTNPASVKLMAVQMAAGENVDENLETARNQVLRCAAKNPDFVMLPEMFVCPYDASRFPDYAEPQGGTVWQALSGLAREAGVCLVAGTVPERDEAGRIYNTSYVFDPAGKQIAKHRKVHLFDIAIRGGQHFRESDTLTPGDSITVFDTPTGPAGLCICYDIRFPELFRRMADQGVKLVFIPASFNMTTGPEHWELTFRARALDNQMFLLGCASARDPQSRYQSWGHSILTDPWGRVLAQLDERAGILTGEIDLSQADAIREQLPLLRHRRLDLYRI